MRESGQGHLPLRGRGTLEAFYQAFQRESHCLSHSPHLLWQQLFNRLQWRQGPIPELLGPELRMRSEPGVEPWLRSRTPLREAESLITTFANHGGPVACCDVSPDGRLVASGGRDGVRVWELATATESASLEGFDTEHAFHFCCCFSPDQKVIASGDWSGTLTLWNAQSGRRLRSVRAHREQVNACHFSPDGAHLVTCSHDKTVKLWDPESLLERLTWEGHEQWVQSCVFLPDGTGVLSAGWDKTLRFWEYGSAEEQGSMEGELFLDCLSISPEGRAGITGSLGKIQVWDLWARVLEHTYGRGPVSSQKTRDDINACMAGPDGTWVAAAHGDGRVSIRPMFGAKEPRYLVGHGGAVECCAVTPDGSKIVSGSADGTLKVWDARREVSSLFEEERFKRLKDSARSWADTALVALHNDYGLPVHPDRPRHHDGPINGCTFGPDGSWIVTCSDDRGVILWDAENGRWIRTLGFKQGPVPEVSGHEDMVGACSVSGDGSTIASAGDDGFLVWDRISGELRCVLGPTAGPGGWPAGGRHCAVGPDSRAVAAVQNLVDHVTIWNATDGSEVAVLKGSDATVSDCAWSNDGCILVSAHEDGALIAWKVNEWKELHRFETGEVSLGRTCAIDESGNRLISGGGGGILTIFDVQTGSLTQSVPAHAGGVRDCAAAPTGDIAASVGEDRFLRIWDTAKGEGLAAVPLPSPANCVALSRTEPSVAVGDTAGDLHIFDLVGIGYETVASQRGGRGRPSELGLPKSREERFEWLQRMKVGHLTTPATGRPPLWFCLMCLAAKGLSGAAGLLLASAGLASLIKLFGGEVESTLLIQLSLGGLATLASSLALLKVVLGPPKVHRSG